MNTLSYLTDSSETLYTPIELQIDTQGGLYFLDTTNTQEPNITVESFLGLTQTEKKMIQEKKQQGFFLLGDKIVGQDYPDYFKKFHRQNINLFLNSNEVLEPRDASEEIEESNGMFPNREKRELIFVKLNLPKNTPQVIVDSAFDFKSTVNTILSHIGIKK